MNIQISNNCNIEIEKDETGYYLTATGNNGCLIQIMNINKRYLKQLNKDINKILEIKVSNKKHKPNKEKYFKKTLTEGSKTYDRMMKGDL